MPPLRWPVMKNQLSIDGYMDWANEVLKADFRASLSRNVYNVNLQTALNAVLNHPFFTDLDAKLEIWAEEYRAQTKSRLFMSSGFPPLLIKPYDSAVNKSFRVNVMENESFPEQAPERGWVTPGQSV